MNITSLCAGNCTNPDDNPFLSHFTDEWRGSEKVPVQSHLWVMSTSKLSVGSLTPGAPVLKPLGCITFWRDRRLTWAGQTDPLSQRLRVLEGDEIIHHNLNDNLKTHGLRSDLGKVQRHFSTLLSLKPFTFQNNEVVSILCDVRISLLGHIHSDEAPLS